ncbi:heterokaryon incompatibility protein-domain-containing protein [Xylaria digitata]|nr:heterokaryon incompatibility protein-domain-containing protein [Xylaria digitata]
MPIVDWFIWYPVFISVFRSAYWGIFCGAGFCALSAGIVLFMRPNDNFAAIQVQLIQPPVRVTTAKYVHVSERADFGHHLFPSCIQWTAASKLVLHTSRITLRIVEWHALGEDQGISELGRPCHLYKLLWHLVDQQNERHSASTSGEQWEVKVWIEGLISPFTYAQLHSGRCAVGRRLFIHDVENRNGHVNQPSTDSDAHIQLAGEWITSYQDFHALCSSPRAVPDSLPSRLLAISPPAPGDSMPKVRVAPALPLSCANADIVYCALSHSWGGSATLRLVEANQEDLAKGVDLQLLSKNIRDAICITHRLGYQYIWVDSLCIIQDDDADWKREAAKMGDIYAGAAVTTAVTSSNSGDEGCFRQRDTAFLKPCELGASPKDALLPDRIYAFLDGLTDFRDSVDDGPLNHRDWVLQERLLSRRILHFGERMMYWECAQRSASELNVAGFVYKKYPDDFHGNFLPASEVEPLVAPRGLPQRLHMTRQQLTPPPDVTGQDRLVWQTDMDSFWKETRQRTYTYWIDDDDGNGNGDNDSRPAPGSELGLGPGSRFRTALERLVTIGPTAVADYGFLSYNTCWYTISTRRDYVAGLWADTLTTDLLWFVPGTPGARIDETASPRQKQALQNAQRVWSPTTIAPTWSWMSVDAAVSIDPPNPNPDNVFRGKSPLTACSASMEDVDMDPRGKLLNAVKGTLYAEGPLLSCRAKFLDSQGRWFLLPTDKHHVPFASFFPDISDHQCEWHADMELYCLAVLDLTAVDGAKFTMRSEKWRQIKGIVLIRAYPLFAPPNSFQRIGYFSTQSFGCFDGVLERFKYAPRTEVYVT